MNEVAKNIIDTTVKTVRVPKVSQAREIFSKKLESRSRGEFTTYRDFRFSVVNSFVISLGVNQTTASTMYNNLKSEAQKLNPSLKLVRDPKKVKEKTTSGKRGRPVGSKNKPKTAFSVIVDTLKKEVTQV